MSDDTDIIILLGVAYLGYRYLYKPITKTISDTRQRVQEVSHNWLTVEGRRETAIRKYGSLEQAYYELI